MNLASWCLGLVCLVSTVDVEAGKRIIGGDDAISGNFPFVAAIHVQTSDSKFFCGGTLLNRRWILTSGYCAKSAELFTIQLGSMTLTTVDPNRVTYATSEYVLHPDFNGTSVLNDIALIKLRLPITFTNYIHSISLPTETLEAETEVTTVGWGQTSDEVAGLSEHLKMVDLVVLSNDECKMYYGSQIVDTMVCVEGNYNEGICTSDSGGPLIRYSGSSYSLVGIASFVSGNGCESTEPSGFTRIFPYLDWIKSVITE